MWRRRRSRLSFAGGRGRKGAAFAQGAGAIRGPTPTGVSGEEEEDGFFGEAGEGGTGGFHSQGAQLVLDRAGEISLQARLGHGVTRGDHD
jgi:hypothetical protein